MKRSTSKDHLSLDGARDQRHRQKERDSLSLEFSTPQRPANTVVMKKKCPRFWEKEGGGARQQRLKDVF